ncbi:MAG: hypothetical protein KDD82_21840, partial [Planctomycetes bacterium]|nr:hypothetical protein [Planctomycetota bacterium]
VTVVPDTESNSLVITSSPKNFARLRGIVAQLDAARREVFIECLIAEVQLNDKGELGIQWAKAFTNSVDNEKNGTSTLGTDFGLDALGDGLRYTTTSDSLTGLLRALQTEGRLNILSSPKILVLDNAAAEISVGQEVPFVTNSRITQNGDTVNTIQYRDVGVILQVTPQINADGLVRLVVHPEVSSIAPDSQSVTITQGVRSPTFNKNFADTTIVINNGETAVIGGLIRDSYSETQFSIPFLGQIPVLGRLFGSTIEETTKQEIVVFLTPHVVEHPGALRSTSRRAMNDFALVPSEILERRLERWVTGLDDASHAFHYNRGTVMLEGGRTEAAIYELELARDLLPTHVDTRLNLALALGNAGKLREAIEEMNVARGLDRADPELAYMLGALFWRAEDYPMALRNFAKALELDPKHEDAAAWLPRAAERVQQLERELLEEQR